MHDLQCGLDGRPAVKCPQCKDPDLVMSERKGIEVDYCPQCRGVWLDRGELDKIIEAAQAEHQPRTAPPAVPPVAPVRRNDDDDDKRRKYGDQYGAHHRDYDDRSGYRRDYDDDDDRWKHGKQRKKRGMLGEIFD